MYRHNLIRRMAASIVALAIAVPTFAGVGVPSAAAASLAISQIHCESGVWSGHTPSFSCEAYVSGGSEPYTYQWQALQNAAITQGSNDWLVGGFCNGGTTASVLLTVQDSAGNTVAKTKSFYCNAGPYP